MCFLISTGFLLLKENKWPRKNQLQRIFKEQVVSERLQDDNGGEFKKQILQKKLNQNDQMPSHHNPKCQGKIELSDRVFGGKSYSDMIQYKKTCVKCVA